MKTPIIFSVILFSCVVSVSAFSQNLKTESFKVSGNCGMCEAKIEKAAKAAGASYADWNKNTKTITVKYSSSSSNLAKIQQSIAGAGYDNSGIKANADAYYKLDKCCQYERGATAKACCENEKCTKDGCAGMECCTDKECCVKDESAKKDCCNEGKCTKGEHKGKDCCQKS